MSWELPPPALTLRRCDAVTPAEEVVYFILHGNVEKDDDKILKRLYDGIMSFTDSWRDQIQYHIENIQDLTADQQQRFDKVNAFYERYRNNHFEFGKKKSKKSARKSKKSKKSKKRKSVKRGKKKSAKKSIRRKR